MSFRIRHAYSPVSKKILLNVNGYVYTLNKRVIRKHDGVEIFYWSCRNKCGMVFRTAVDNGVHVKDDDFHASGVHGHRSDSTDERGGRESPDRHGGDAAAQPLDLSRECGADGPTVDYTADAGGRPSDARTFDHMPYVPPELKTTLSGQTFYVRDTGTGEHRIVILSTAGNVRLLSGSDFWLINGTPHCTTDSRVRHMYTVHGHVDTGHGNHTCAPLVFGLFASPSGDALKIMFAELKCFARRHGVSFSRNTGTKIVTDVDASVVDTVSVTFPTAVRLIGLFHFSTHIYRRIHAEGLAVRFLTDSNFNLLCRYLLAMAFLPVSKIIEGFDRIKPLFSNDCREQNLLNYFESTFVTRKSRVNVHGQNPAEISPPFFHPETWSVITHNGVDSSQVKTFIGESWHCMFNKLLSKQTTLYESISQLQHLQNETEYVLKNGFDRYIPKDYKKAKYQREEYIRKLVLEFKNNPQFDVLLFLNEIACNLNFKNLHTPGEFRKRSIFLDP